MANKSKKELSIELAAALHSGAIVDPTVLAAAQAAADEEAAAEAAASATAKAATAAAAAAALAADPDGSKAKAAKEAADKAKSAATVNGKSSLIAHLQSENEKHVLNSATLNSELSELKKQNATLVASNTALNKVVLTASQKLCVALNTSAVLLTALKDNVLCEQYDTLSAELAKKFKVGAQSDSGQNVTQPVVAAANDAMSAAAVQATSRK